MLTHLPSHLNAILYSALVLDRQTKMDIQCFLFLEYLLFLHHLLIP